MSRWERTRSRQSDPTAVHAGTRPRLLRLVGIKDPAMNVVLAWNLQAVVAPMPDYLIGNGGVPSPPPVCWPLTRSFRAPATASGDRVTFTGVGPSPTPGIQTEENARPTTHTR
jgi:hypothetical protein